MGELEEAQKRPSAKPRLAVITSEAVGRPDLSDLGGRIDVSYSDEVGVSEALTGARAVFLWDTALAGVLGASLDRCPELEWVHAAVTGVDTLPLKVLALRGCVLTNAAGIYDDAIAEYVLAACLGFERRLAVLRDQQREHDWSWLQGSMLKGKRVLVVGPGRIGRSCARLLKAVGCEVAALASEAKAADELFAFIGASRDITSHIGWADHIVITAPLTKATCNLINGESLAACKPSAHLVNVGRGGIVDTDALVCALGDGLIAGATLDVLKDEPLDKESPIWDIPGVVITPHIAGDVDGFEDLLVAQFCENAELWLCGEQMKNVVDLRRGY